MTIKAQTDSEQSIIPAAAYREALAEQLWFGARTDTISWRQVDEDTREHFRDEADAYAEQWGSRS